MSTLLLIALSLRPIIHKHVLLTFELTLTSHVTFFRKF